VLNEKKEVIIQQPNNTSIEAPVSALIASFLCHCDKHGKLSIKQPSIQPMFPWETIHAEHFNAVNTVLAVLGVSCKLLINIVVENVKTPTSRLCVFAL